MTDGFVYQQDTLTADGVPLPQLAEQYGTPLYVYSGAQLRKNFRRVADAFSALDAMVAYSVKSNSNLSVLRLLEAEGACFDIVSGGELARVKKVGVPGSRIIFAGVGKQEWEMRAALEHGVKEFNLESEMEAERLNGVAAAMGVKAPVAIRVNPDVDAKTHKKISTGGKESKFGISRDRALALARRMGKDLAHLELLGLHCHIGSQILDPTRHAEAVKVISQFTREVMNETKTIFQTLNFGGGFGIAYRTDQEPLDLGPFAAALEPELKELGVQLILEPGRSISASAGLLLTRVQFLKKGENKNFVILDGAMTELMRPTLYDAYHDIRPVIRRAGETTKADFVGPVCETGDYLALDRETIMPAPGDLLAIMDAGAYGFVMSSNYNTRPRPAEILLIDGKATVARKREALEDCWRGEE